MIVFDTEKMLETYHKINLINRQLENNISNIEKLIQGIEGDWQGEAEKAYADKIIYIKSKFLVLNEFYNSYAEQLKEYARQYEAHEKELISKINLV